MYWLIGIIVRVFASCLGDCSSIPDQVIPKVKKQWYSIAPCLTKHCKVKGKWSNPGKEVAPSPYTLV